MSSHKPHHKTDHKPQAIAEGEYFHLTVGPNTSVSNLTRFTYRKEVGMLTVEADFDDNPPLGYEYEWLRCDIMFEPGKPVGTFAFPTNDGNSLTYRTFPNTIAPGNGSITITALDVDNERCTGSMSFTSHANSFSATFEISGEIIERDLAAAATRKH